MNRFLSPRILVALVAVAWVGPLEGAPQVVRVVTYNIKADTDGNTTPQPGLYTVLEAIGQQLYNGVVQPLDVLALQETTSNNTTVAPIVTALNNYYGANLYAMSPVQASQSGSPSYGNGPNALVFNASTLQLLQSTRVPGTPNSNGTNRQVMRYQFQSLGGTADTVFYVYVSHMKSSSSGVESENQAARDNEAQLIRQNAATLPAGARILYVGDFNMGSSSEAAYVTMTEAGVGQAVDPAVWSSPTPRILMSYASYGIRYRDDWLFMTTDVASNAALPGLRYVSASSRVFGNNGTTPVGNSVNSSSNTALNNLQGPITPSSAKSALVTASDHLPVVADYQLLSPFEAWQEQHFTPAQLNNPAISGASADGEGDGVVNALEYGLALNPNFPDAGKLPKSGTILVSGNNYLTLTYTRPRVANDLAYAVEVSSNLSTWLTGSTYTTTVSTTNNPDGVTQTVVVRDRSAMSGLTKRVMRLRIIGP